MTGADERLFAQAKAGDVRSLDQLLERYLPQLHAYVRVRLSADVRARESSMDVVQSVCRNLLAERARFDFRGEERFRAWLFTAALNKIRTKHRFHREAPRDVRRQVDLADSDQVLVQSLLSPSQDAMVAENVRGLNEALATLSEEHREVITLARIVNLPHSVIAEVMGRSEEASRQLLARALLRLTQELHRRGIAP